MNKSEKREKQIKIIVNDQVLYNQTQLVDALLNASWESTKPIIGWEDIVNFRVNTEKEAKDMGYESLEVMEDSDGTEKEVFEWWLVTDWLADKIEALGGVIIKSDYGTWWGREECGQALTMDSTIKSVADYLIKL